MPNKMSHDRVSFFLSSHRVESAFAKFDELLRFAFDMNTGQFVDAVSYDSKVGCPGVTITCRPSQFARFLIKRNDLGLTNGFKELGPELFVPRHENCGNIDVSKRTHKPLFHGQGCQDEDQ